MHYFYNPSATLRQPQACRRRNSHDSKAHASALPSDLGNAQRCVRGDRTALVVSLAKATFASPAIYLKLKNLRPLRYSALQAEHIQLLYRALEHPLTPRSAAPSVARARTASQQRRSIANTFSWPCYDATNTDMSEPEVRTGFPHEAVALKERGCPPCRAS